MYNRITVPKLQKEPTMATDPRLNGKTIKARIIHTVPYKNAQCTCQLKGCRSIIVYKVYSAFKIVLQNYASYRTELGVWEI